MLAYRLGFTFLHYMPELTGVPLGPSLMHYWGGLMRPLLFRHPVTPPLLGTASGAPQVGPLAAIAVGSYIALAGLVGAPVSGASMNPARSLGPALVIGDWTSWWAYLAGPGSPAE